ncbi:DUF945 family protein [Microbulbifer sp. SAOS-129_SWC]|uniref:DUF945 family protein n=1 Tax=Microbulbifer sp. SAOS-129_SWC TaxID=3145235 RepID=UPI0032173373
MKLLRLSLLCLFVLLLSTALAMPGIVGPKVEEVWKQQLGQNRGVSVAEYRRGWFGARATTALQARDGATELRSKIQHGPLLFTAEGPRLGAVYSETRLSTERLQPQLRAQLEQFYGRLEHSPLVLESLVGFDNRVHNTLHLEPFTRSDAGGKLKFDGGTLQFETDYRGAALDGTLQLGASRLLQGGIEKFRSAQASGKFHYVVAARRGEASIQLPQLHSDSDSGPLELHNADLQLNIQLLNSGLLKLVGDLNLPQVQSATPVTSLKQHLTLPQISVADLGHYLGALLAPPADGNWQRVMRRPLQLQQQLAIQSANGPMLVDADLDWRGLSTAARPVNMAPDQWLVPLTGDVTFAAAEQALMQSPLVGQAMTLRKYGLLLEDGDELQMHLQVKRGQLQVNGQPLPADLFMMALMGQF